MVPADFLEVLGSEARGPGGMAIGRSGEFAQSKSRIADWDPFFAVG